MVFSTETLHVDGILEPRFLLTPGYGHRNHNGHAEKNPDEVKIPSTAIAESELQLAFDTATSQCPTGTIAAVLDQRGNGLLSANQVEHLKKLAERVEENPAWDDDPQNPANEIVRYLESEKISHVVLYDEPDLDLFKVSAQRSSAKKRKKNSRRPLKCIRKLSAGLAGFIEELLDIDPDELKAPPATRELES